MKKSMLVVVCTVILTGILVFLTGSITEAQTRNLFELKESPRARPEAEKSSVASLRESEIAISDSSIKANKKKKQRLPLLDGKIYEAALSNFEERGPNDFTWRGKIVYGKTAHDVILTFKNGHVAGLIYAPSAIYEIVPVGAKHMLVELDQSRFPECAGDVKSDDTLANVQNLVPEGGTDSGDRIDVLLLYTTPVKNSLGGEAQAQTFAQSAIDSANTAYLNSKIRLRLRLVHAQETTFAETGSLSTELSGFRSAAETTTLRNQYNADLVAMISNSADNCGIGYLGNSGGNTSAAFTVTSRTCVVGNLSFAHELGHNMGSQHNPENGSGAAFPYSYGHYVNGNFRTVMSYVDPCPNGCTRRPYFSNPSVLFSGLPTGIEGTRYNARSINNTADIIATYRYSGSSITMTGYNGGEIIPRYMSRVVTWSSAGFAGGNVRIEISRTESTIWETLIASTPNDGSATVNVPGRPTKNARLRITSIESPTVSDSSIGNIAIK